MHGAGAAQSGATAEFRAGQSKRVAQNPEQWRVRRNINFPFAAVYPQSDVWHGSPASFGMKQNMVAETNEKGNVRSPDSPIQTDVLSARRLSARNHMRRIS